MNDYELKLCDELQEWKQEVTKRSGIMNRLSKKAQTKINGIIPEKVHSVVTEGIKGMVKATLVGSQYTNFRKQPPAKTLEERDELARKKIAAYQKAAVIEGAGTGAGGILLGLADFPLLLAIKMKALFELAAVYGYDTSEYSERLFILHVFKLAFSSDEARREAYEIIDHWDQKKEGITEIDWREFQQEYRDYLDLAKLLQLVPGIGAFVGAYANNNLLKHLGDTAMNAYRLRILKESPHAD